MTTPLVNWKRFWTSRTGSISLADNGYLVDPDSGAGRVFNRDVVSFSAIAARACLVLLGEPGIGKTTAMTSLQADLDREVSAAGDRTLWVNLNLCSDEAGLYRRLFDSATYQQWLTGDFTLHLFLDSLDECLLRIDTVATVILEELAKVPRNRLRLRVASRTAEWPRLLDEGLPRLFGKDVGFYELVPLRKIDVAEAARVFGVDEQLFLSEVDRRDAKPLAIKPVTLFLLLRIFNARSGLPATQLELFREGCKTLCVEESATRQAARLTGDLDPLQRVLIARRIAALMMFAKRSAVCLEGSPGESSPEDLTVEEICGGIEREDRIHVDVVRSSVREVLDTGLFSSRGPNRLGWAHQTYLEFLASEFVRLNAFSGEQLTSLLMHPNEPDRVIPQLHELAAWVANANTQVFDLIVQRDPQVLLRSDVENIDTSRKERLVDSLLQGLNDATLRINWDLYRYYRRLKHSGLSNQLRPYVVDKSKRVGARITAIHLAEECAAGDLQDELLAVALDSSDDVHVRQAAVSAIGRVASVDAKKQLRVLAETSADAIDDNLKAEALDVLWPDMITAEELFRCLTRPQKPNHFGAYHTFALRAVKRLQPRDLSYALKWVGAQPPNYGLDSYFADAADDVLRMAWDAANDPAVMSEFAEAALYKIRQYEPIFRRNEESGDPFLAQLERRRRLVEALVRIVGAESRDDTPSANDSEQRRKFDLSTVVFESNALVQADDLSWLIEKYSAASGGARRIWLTLIVTLVNVAWYGKRPLDVLLEAIEQDVELALQFRGYFDALELDSDSARGQKRRFYEYQKMTAADEAGAPSPSVAERLQRALEKCEAGDLDVYWQLQGLLSFDANGRAQVDEFKSDLLTYPGWLSADAPTQRRISDVSKRYLAERDCNPAAWVGKNLFNRPAAAGCRALRLLSTTDPDWFAAIPAEIWRKWAPSIIGFPNLSEQPKELVGAAYRNAPDELLTTAFAIADSEDRDHKQIFIIRPLLSHRDQRMQDALLSKARDQKLSPTGVGDLLEPLLERQNAEAISFALSLVPTPIPTTERERALAREAAVALLTYSPTAGWQSVWNAMNADDAFGREVITKVASHPLESHKGTLATRLREDEVAGLYLWMSARFPPVEGPEVEGAPVVSERENIGDYREAVLRTLPERGTPAALAALKRITQALPSLDLSYMIAHAQTMTLRKTWIPPTPNEILDLTEDSKRRLVSSGEQLMAVVKESLERLQQRLQGELPEARFLWDKQKGPPETWIPVEEATFSDYVARHLIEDLRERSIIVNREVEIRRQTGGAPGERTDIHVDTVMRGSSSAGADHVKLIIEAKGCWNRGLENDMERQLKNKYLRDNDCRHGICLVGWFNCPQWDRSDYRCSDAPTWSIAEAEQRFDGQAAQLSDDRAVLQAVVLNVALR